MQTILDAFVVAPIPAGLFTISVGGIIAVAIAEMIRAFRHKEPDEPPAFKRIHLIGHGMNRTKGGR